jgi:hypothetical protein
MDQEIENLSRKLHELCLHSRVFQIAGTPEMPTYQGQTVGEIRRSFVIPGRHRDRNPTILAQPQGQHRDEGKQGQQDRGRPGDGLVRLLPLGLQVEMGADLLKRHLDRLAHDDPCQDLYRRRLQIGTNERLDAQLPLRVRHHDAADRHRRQLRGGPQGGVGEDPELLALAAVPVHRHRLPRGLGAFCPPLHAALALALQEFGSASARGLWCGGG